MAITAIWNEAISDHAKVTKELEEKLLNSLAQLNPQCTNTSIVLSAGNSLGRIVVGVSGSASYGWLLIKKMWVVEGQRVNGIGKG